MEEKIRVALVNPRGFNKNISSAAPPYNLGYLASYLDKHISDVNVIIIDGLAGQNIEKILLDFNPNIIGITATTPAVPAAYKIADFSKKNISEALVVMGGVHASTMPNEAIQHVDIVVVGEGEKAFLEIVKNFSQNKKITEKIITRPYIKDLDEISEIPWHLMDMEFYINSADNTSKTIPYTSSKSRAMTILSSRGCPYRCIFCHNSWRSTPARYHSVEWIIKEIQYLYDEYKIDSIFFADDEFLANQVRLKEFCQLIHTKGLDKKIVWGCQARSDTICRLGENMMKLIKSVGCTTVSIGMESGSQRILDILKNKTVSVERSREAAILCRQAGLKVCGSFMIGTPTETKEDMMQTLQFIENNKDYINLVGTGVTTPYPGTRLWEWCLEENLIPDNIDYSSLCPDPRFGLQDWRILCKTMSKKEFRSIFKKINRKAAEITTRHNIKSNDFSLQRLIRIITRHPFYSFKFFLKQPREAMSLFKKIFKFRK